MTGSQVAGALRGASTPTDSAWQRLGSGERDILMSDRAYDLLRAIVERLGGSMLYERKGYRHGAWVISIGANSTTIEARREPLFPAA